MLHGFGSILGKKRGSDCHPSDLNSSSCGLGAAGGFFCPPFIF